MDWMCEDTTYYIFTKCCKEFNNGPDKICRRQDPKKSKNMVFQFQKLSSTNFTWLILESFVSDILWSTEDAGGIYCAQNLF